MLPGTAAAFLAVTATGATGAHTLTDGSNGRAQAASSTAESLETRRQVALRSDLAERLTSEQRIARDRDRQALQRRAAAAKAAAAARARANRWVLPIAQYRLSSNYGPRWGRLHAGIDFAAPIGTPLVAMHAGTVIFADQQSGYGNKVEIRYTDGTAPTTPT